MAAAWRRFLEPRRQHAGQALSLLVIIFALAVGLALHISGAANGEADIGEDAGMAPAEVAAANAPPPPPLPPRLARAELWNKGKARNVITAWYDVPENSLAKRRAAEEEFTAAHNQLPIGTLVRVTHLKNGKSVLVRITDRGIRDRRVTLDVCKEAAEALGIVSKGLARVRMQVVEETSGVSVAESEASAP
jgi:rare lipoprotein A